MSEVAVQQASATPASPQVFKWWPKPTKLEKVLRHILAISAWCYFVVDIFLFDLDASIKNHMPTGLAWLVEYKFFVFITLAAIVLATVSTRRIVAWSIYIFFYPLSRFVKFCFYAGVFLYVIKSWPLLFSVINMVLSFIKSFKVNFILLSITVTCSVAILVSTSPETQNFCAFALTTVAFAVIIRRLFSLFHPSKFFQMYTKLMAALLNYGQKHFAPEPNLRILTPAAMDQKQLDEWSANLQQAVLFSELCNFLIRKFSEYRKGSLPTVYYLLNFIGLLAIVIYLFSMINEAVARADSHAFLFANGRHYFDFLYYSFSTLFVQRIPDVTPVSVIARVVWMIETFFAFLLVAIVISIGFALRKSLDDAGIEEVIGTLRSQSATMETFVQSEFSLSLDGAVAELDKLKKGVTGLINILRAVQG